MDTFASDTNPTEPVDLKDVRAQVKALEDQHRAAGIPLSGRVLHVTHYLPVTATLDGPAPSAMPSPPASPSSKTATAEPSDAKWRLAPRIGHSAMISGIRSLSSTHEQVIIGWTGDLYAGGAPPPNSAPAANALAADVLTAPGAAAVADVTAQVPPSGAPTRISLSGVSPGDRAALEAELLKYDDRTQESAYNAGQADRQDGDARISLVPVWLDDKIAHGHYEGYCKASEFSRCLVPSCSIRRGFSYPLSLFGMPAQRRGAGVPLSYHPRLDPGRSLF
jgi:trehalose 6-phosphate synthase/phosphatase